jgi:hypothetical protein
MYHDNQRRTSIMWQIHHGARKLAVWLVILLPGMLTLGCDRPLPPDPDISTGELVEMLIDAVDDFSHHPKEVDRIKQLFIPGSEPSKEALARYSDYHYEGKPPVVSGDSATVTVTLKDVKTGNPVGEVQWTLVKVNKGWKFKDAPLPK